MNRRSFLSITAVACTAFRDDAIERVYAAAPPAARSAGEVALDEDFWFRVRHAFTIDRGLINLNNGGVSPAPRVVQDAMNRYLEMQNMNPLYYMWRILDPQVEGVRLDLAKEFGCDTEEIAITRNASEALSFHQSIGVERKAARLRYLRRCWTQRLEKIPGVRSLTPDDPAQAAGLGLLSVDGMKATGLSSQLFRKQKIIVTTVKIESEFPYEDIRITPNVHTTLGESDTLCEGVEQAVRDRG